MSDPCGFELFIIANTMGTIVFSALIGDAAASRRARAAFHDGHWIVPFWLQLIA